MENTAAISDYTQDGKIVPLQWRNVKTYAVVNTEYLGSNEGLLPTDNYFVYLLHPKFGSCHFTIVQDENDEIKAIDGPSWLEDAAIQQILEGINTRQAS